MAEPIAVDLILSNEPSARELTNILSCFARHGQTSSELVKEIFKQMDEADLGPEHAVECYCLLKKFKASAKSSKFLASKISKQVQLLRPNETFDVFMASKVLKATPTFMHSLFQKMITQLDMLSTAELMQFVQQCNPAELKQVNLGYQII